MNLHYENGNEIINIPDGVVTENIYSPRFIIIIFIIIIRMAIINFLKIVNNLLLTS